jgi:hypothetical protein
MGRSAVMFGLDAAEHLDLTDHSFVPSKSISLRVLTMSALEPQPSDRSTTQFLELPQ